MKIDSKRLRTLRERKRFTRPQLAERSGITERTIQRLENEPHLSQKSREDTLNRLAKALSIKPGVLTGELSLPESNDMPANNPERVRLAYDLIKRRYGVSKTEIINMAPLFFALLAEGSLARRREKLEEAEEAIKRLNQIETVHRMFAVVADYGDEAYGKEEYSIARADIFGDYLSKDSGGTIDVLVDEPFDPDEDNPFAHYLQQLANELDIPSVVDVDGGDLNMASNYKFPHYDICREELDHITNGSPIARICLETGYVRISEIPKELMAEDACEERAKWLEEKLPDFIKEIAKKDEKNIIIETIATLPQSDELKDALKKVDSQKTNSETEKEGDDK